MVVRQVVGPQRAWGSKRWSTTDPPEFYKRHKIVRVAPETYTYDEGTYVASGNGVTRVFTFPHLLGVLPRYATVDAASKDARPPFTVSTSTTDVTVTFAEAPLSGTNNVSLAYRMMTG